MITVSEDSIVVLLKENVYLFLLLILAAVIFGNFLIWMYEVVIALTTSYSLNYGEGFIMYYAKNWDLMYDPVSLSPYLVTNYPPLYPFLAGTIDILVDNIFISSRLISIISAFSITGLISLVVYKSSSNSSVSISLLSGLLFLFSTITSGWGVYARVDILGVCFGVLSIFWYLFKEGKLQLLGAGLFCLLALFTKQSLFAAPLAIFLTLMIKKEYERGIIFAIGLGIVGLTLLAGLNYVTEGQAWLHIVVYNQNSFSFYKMFASVKSIFINNHSILLGFGITTVLLHYDEVPNVLILYFLTGGVSSLLVGKVGAGPNYFLTFLVSTVILFGIFLSKSQFSGVTTNINVKRQNSVSVLIVLLLIIQFSLFIVPPSGTFAGAKTADSAIEHSDGPVLSEDSALLVNNNQEVLYQPFIMNQLESSGKWDQTPVVRSIKTVEYDYIVLHFNVTEKDDWHTSRWSQNQLQAIDENYQLTQESERYWVYAPKNKDINNSSI